MADEHDVGAKEKLPLPSGSGSGLRLLGGTSNTSAREEVRDELGGTSDHGVDHPRASTPENRHEESEDEQVNVGSPRKARYQRRVVSEDEDEVDESERERDTSTRSQVAAVASPGVQSSGRR